MADWFEAHRTALLLAATALVTFPILIGALRGHAPRSVLLKFATPLVGMTVLLAMGAYTLARTVEPGTHLWLSAVFAVLFLAVGMELGLRLPRRVTMQLPAHRAARGLGIVFLVYGVIALVLTAVAAIRN